ELDAGAGVPVALDEVSCDHPAVRVELLHADRARAPAVALARWDPGPLRADGETEEVSFRLRARALPEVVFTQRVCLRMRRPLQFQPATLAIDSLTEDTPEARLVRITNQDSRPVVIRAVTPEAPWVVGADLE